MYYTIMPTYCIEVCLFYSCPEEGCNSFKLSAVKESQYCSNGI